jgi:Holliday junction resolvasome RuvABC endonuclease subunit
LTSERVLSLDISSKTGWNVTISSDDGISLLSYGQIPKIPKPDRPYPESYILWAYNCYEHIEDLIERHGPDVVVIEETAANSKTSHSQKILEWIHFLVAKRLVGDNIRTVYFLTGEWRKLADSKMTKDESNHNKLVKKYKEKTGSKIAYNDAGKRIGKITKKHVAIRRANEVFGKYFPAPLRKKDEDMADALCLGLAYHLKRTKKE